MVSHLVVEAYTNTNHLGLNIRLRSSRFVNAVLVHNAAEIGDANQAVLDIGRETEKLQVMRSRFREMLA